MQYLEERGPFYKWIWYDKLQPERFLTWLLKSWYTLLCYGSILLFIFLDNTKDKRLVYILLALCLLFTLVYWKHKRIKSYLDKVGNLFPNGYRKFSRFHKIQDLVLKYNRVKRHYWLAKVVKLFLNWLNLKVKLIFYGLGKDFNISDLRFYYSTPSGTNVWVLSVTRFKRKLPKVDKSVYKSIGATLALFDYCYRDPISATLRFWPEIIVILSFLLMHAPYIALLLIIMLFIFKGWLIYRFIYKLFCGYLLVIKQNEVEYDTHPHLRAVLERLDRGDLSTIGEAWKSLSVWRIVFPFLSLGG